jgi:hypothetical protein
MKKISFKKLPRDVQNTIIRLQRPDSDRFVFFGRLSPLYWLPVAGAAIWLFYLGFSTQYYLWEEWMFWIFAGVTVVAVLAGAYALEKIISSRFGKLKSGYIFTPEECLKISSGWIGSWNYREIEALRFHEDLEEIELWSGSHEERIKTTQKLDAIRLCETFDEWKANAGEGVLAKYATGEYAYSSGMKYGLTAVGAVICVVLAGAISFGAKKMNADYDDRETWARTESFGTIEEYEAYKVRHPNGIYAAEADRKIGDILVKLKDAYKARAKKSADPNAVNALALILEEAARRPDRTIFVKLNETLELDEEVIDKMKETTGQRFEPLDSSVPKSRADFRKNKMFGDVRQAFTSITGNGALRFEISDDPPAGAPVMNVSLVVKTDSKEMPYLRWTSFDGYKQNTSYYSGAKWDFDFQMKGSDAGSAYQTGYTAIPKSLNSGVFDVRDSANYSFDRVYFASVSEGFGYFLGQVFGLVE